MSTLDLGVTAETALPGRDQAMVIKGVHTVLGTSMFEPFPAEWDKAIVAMGCFWGVERLFWQLEGVRTTAVGYTAGFTPNPSYEEVCSKRTGHTEAVLIGYDPGVVSYEQILRTFWQGHDPTQGMRQGNDRGTQYRSGLYFFNPEQEAAARRTRELYQAELSAAGYGPITTEIAPAGPFYYAEDYHQQYLDKNPRGYCGIGGTGVSCPVGLST